MPVCFHVYAQRQMFRLVLFYSMSAAFQIMQTQWAHIAYVVQSLEHVSAELNGFPGPRWHQLSSERVLKRAGAV